MKVVNAKELSDLMFKDTNRSKNSGVRIAVAQLKVGEALQVEKDDWRSKTAPATWSFQRKGNSARYRVRALANEVGWVIVRTK